MSKYDAFVIDLTPLQRAQIDSTLKNVRPGEAVIAQMYGDGMRVKLLTPEQVDAVRRITGSEDNKLEHNSAYKAQAVSENVWKASKQND